MLMVSERNWDLRITKIHKIKIIVAAGNNLVVFLFLTDMRNKSRRTIIETISVEKLGFVTIELIHLRSNSLDTIRIMKNNKIKMIEIRFSFFEVDPFL